FHTAPMVFPPSAARGTLGKNRHPLIPQHSHTDSAERARATPSDAQLAALRSAVANGYALIAVLGRTSGESTTYLAREDATGELVAVTADLGADASLSEGLNFVVS